MSCPCQFPGFDSHAWQARIARMADRKVKAWIVPAKHNQQAFHIACLLPAYQVSATDTHMSVWPGLGLCAYLCVHCVCVCISVCCCVRVRVYVFLSMWLALLCMCKCVCLHMPYIIWFVCISVCRCVCV